MYKVRQSRWPGRDSDSPLSSLGAIRKGIAINTECVASDKMALADHEVSVALNEREGRIILELVDNLRQLSVDLLLGAIEGELSDPDGLLEGAVDVEHMVKEGLGINAVDMDVDEINRALSIASIEEFLQPANALVRSAAVGDSWCANLSFACEGVHELDVFLGRQLRRHVGLRVKIGFVEAKETAGASINRFLGIGRPNLGEVELQAPQHWAELKIKTGIVILAPVVGPRDLGSRIDEALQESGIVIGEATLATGSMRVAAAVFIFGDTWVGRRGRLDILDNSRLCRGRRRRERGRNNTLRSRKRAHLWCRISRNDLGDNGGRHSRVRRGKSSCFHKGAGADLLGLPVLGFALVGVEASMGVEVQSDSDGDPICDSHNLRD
jgi:hypothetical protein